MSYRKCGCGREWTGLGQAHCQVCHQHFSSVATFSRHKPDANGCGDPATMLNRAGASVFRAADSPFGTVWADARRDDRYSADGDELTTIREGRKKPRGAYSGSQGDSGGVQ